MMIPSSKDSSNLGRLSRSSRFDSQSQKNLKDMNLTMEAEESNNMVSLLKKRLQEKMKYESVLQQSLRSIQASSEVLQNAVDSERRAREQLQKDIKAKRMSMDASKGSNYAIGKKEVANRKEMNRLGLQAKDLKLTLAQIVTKERKAQVDIYEVQRKRRELESELGAARTLNSRLEEESDLKDAERSYLEDSLRSKASQLMREANSSKVRVIALRQQHDVAVADIASTREALGEAQATLNSLVVQLRIEDEATQEAGRELQRRLAEEETAHSQLQEEFGKKTKIQVQLERELWTYKTALSSISSQLDQKVALSLELSGRLDQLQKHAQLIEARSDNKTQEVSKLTTELNQMKGGVKTLSTQLQIEKHGGSEAAKSLEQQQQSSVSLRRSINDRQNSDGTTRLKAQRIEGDAELVKGMLDSHTLQTQRAKEALETASSQNMGLTQELTDLKSTLSGLKERLAKKDVAAEKALTKYKTTTKLLQHEEHTAKFSIDEMARTLRSRKETLAQMRSAAVTNEAKIRELMEEVQQSSDTLETQKRNLFRRVSEMSSANALLEDQIQSERGRGGGLENGLLNAETRLRTSLAQLSAQEQTSQGLSVVNTDDQELMMRRISEVTAKVERLAKEQSTRAAADRVLESKLQDEDDAKAHAAKALREERAINAAQKAKIETQIDLLIEQQGRQKMLTQVNQRISDEVKEKTSFEAALRLDLDEASSDANMLQQELREQELKNEELVAAQASNQQQSNELRAALKAQEDSFMADARAVKQCIIGLQDALMGKTDAAEALIKAAQLTKARVADCQARMASTESTVTESQRKYEKLLDEEQRRSAQLRGDVARKKRNMALLEASMDEAGSKIMSLSMTLEENGRQEEILKSDASTKRKEAAMVFDQLEQRRTRHRDLERQMAACSEELAVLRSANRGRTRRENSLESSQKQAQYESNVLKKKLQGKAKGERYMLAEMEALRLHVIENKDVQSAKSLQASNQARTDLARVLRSS